MKPVTTAPKVAWQAKLVAFAGEPSGVQESEAVGEAVLTVQDSCVDAAVDAFPARSDTAPLAIWSVNEPSEFGAARDTVNVYGPALVPLVAPAVQVVDVPPMVRSELLATKPVTDSLNVTEQLRLVALIVPGAGVQLNAVTDGGVRSTVHE